MFKNLSWQEKLIIIASALMPIVLILKDQIIPPFILLFFLTTIPFWKGNKQLKRKAVVYPMLALFLVYGVSSLFVVNTGNASLLIMTKFSFFIFPIIAILMTSGYAVCIKGLKWGIIIGSGVSMLFSFIRAVGTEQGFSGQSFNSNLYGVNMHASYLALIFIIACTFLMFEKSNKRWFAIVKWSYLILTVVSVFYLRSLGAFVCIAVIFMVIPIWNALKKRNWKWLFALPVYGLIFFVGLKSSPRITNDVSQSLLRMEEWSASPKDFLEKNVNVIESNSVRLIVWTIAGGMIVDNPFGVGHGDENDLLRREYYKFGFTDYAERQMNPHNQYLQTGISIGWLGIILLITLFVGLIVTAFKTNDLALFIAFTCIAVSCLFESMLERQVGVIFLSILMLLVSIIRFEQQKMKPSE